MLYTRWLNGDQDAACSQSISSWCRRRFFVDGRWGAATSKHFSSALLCSHQQHRSECNQSAVTECKLRGGFGGVKPPAKFSTPVHCTSSSFLLGKPIVMHTTYDTAAEHWLKLPYSRRTCKFWWFGCSQYVFNLFARWYQCMHIFSMCCKNK